VVNTIQCGSARTRRPHWGRSQHSSRPLLHGRTSGQCGRHRDAVRREKIATSRPISTARACIRSAEEKSVATAKVEATDKLRAEASSQRRRDAAHSTRARAGAGNRSAGTSSSTTSERPRRPEGRAPPRWPPSIARLEPGEQRQVLAATAEKRKALNRVDRELRRSATRTSREGGRCRCAKDSLDQQILRRRSRAGRAGGLEVRRRPEF